jgi:hypothetical protein
VLSLCASLLVGARAAEDDATVIKAAEAAVISELGLPKDARFSGVKVLRSSCFIDVCQDDPHALAVVCGYVSVKEADGDYTNEPFQYHELGDGGRVFTADTMKRLGWSTGCY